MGVSYWRRSQYELVCAVLTERSAMAHHIFVVCCSKHSVFAGRPTKDFVLNRQLISLQICAFNIENSNSYALNETLNGGLFGITLFDKLAVLELNQTGIKRSEPKIIGGEIAKLRGNEHMVSIRYKPNELIKFGSGHFCGGALITPKAVLTASHCLLVPKSTVEWRPSDLITVMGILDRSSRGDHQARDVSKVIVHPNFSMQNFRHDVGILLLTAPFQLTANVKTINFTRTGNDLTTGRPLTISGWGATEMESAGSQYLLTATVNLVDHQECRDAYKLINEITDGMFCAANGVKDSCQGDSGGPVIFDGVINGIVSWGKGCGIIGYPGVYTNVAVYKDWIEKNSAGMLGFSRISLFIFICFSLLLNVNF
ncbi:trypsin-2-like [Condylostylus longicornis]|uniref:trypsin-2-like n=1 Tax=Condylostylus longicornis TaxID=2530218 RepID=UPI00244E2DF9|nr:trypsin-2-like [Condylostylus longicornis]